MTRNPVVAGQFYPGTPDQLSSMGINPEAITDVIITHTHFDHFNGLSRLEKGRPVLNFPQARHYLGKGDWEPNKFGKLEKRTLALAHQEGLMTLVDKPTRDIEDKKEHWVRSSAG